MKKYIGLYFIGILFLFSCNSVPVSEPLWLTDLEEAFPQKEYFAKQGSGNSAQDAILDAQSELASYFSTNVRRVVESNTSMKEDADGNVEKSRGLNVTSVSVSDLDFFALEKTEPFYRKSEKKWYAAAYLNREKAWNQYEPEVRDALNSFKSVFALAEKETDPLKKIRNYNASIKTGNEFIDRLYKAVILSKERTNAAFGKDRALYDSIPGLIQKEKNRCVVYFDIPEDSSGILRSAVNNIFTKEGFLVTESMADAFYIANVRINYNRADEDDLIVMNPGITVSLTANQEMVYVYNGVAEKVLSYNLAKAQKSACTVISEVLKNELPADFKTKTGLSN